MRRAAGVLVLAAGLLGTGLSTPAVADPPREVTGTLQVVSFTPLPQTRRETGKVVHFEFLVNALVQGEGPGLTSEHFRCVRRVGEAIRCTGEVTTDYLDGPGRTESHVRVTCDAALFACEGITHVRGVDNDGDRVLGSGEVSVRGGVGSFRLRLTHG